MIPSQQQQLQLQQEDIEKNNNGESTPEHTIKKQMVASIIGGMTTAFAVTPLDVVKTRLQTNTKHKLGGTLETFIKITKNEGITTLWRGLSLSLVMTIPNSTIYFTTYEHLKEWLYQIGNQGSVNNVHSRFTIPLLAGSLARIVSATFTSPIELIRTNSQGLISKQHQGPGLNSFILLKDIYKNVGVTGLWRGFIPTLIRDVPFSALYWSGYEVTKEILMKNHLSDNADKNYSIRLTPTPFYVNFLSGAISGTFAAMLTTPIDVIKTRIQMSAHNDIQHIEVIHRFSKSPIQNLKMIMEKEGWKGLTKGMVPRVAKVSPACAIMVSTYEWVKSVDF